MVRDGMCNFDNLLWSPDTGNRSHCVARFELRDLEWKWTLVVCTAYSHMYVHMYYINIRYVYESRPLPMAM